MPSHSHLMNYLQLEFYKLQAPAKIYVHKIAENFHNNNLKDNSCDITLWELLTKCETITWTLYCSFPLEVVLHSPHHSLFWISVCGASVLVLDKRVFQGSGKNLSEDFGFSRLSDCADTCISSIQRPSEIQSFPLSISSSSSSSSSERNHEDTTPHHPLQFFPHLNQTQLYVSFSTLFENSHNVLCPRVVKISMECFWTPVPWMKYHYARSNR